MVIAFSSIGLTFHPSNLTASGSQSFAEPSGDSKGRSPWRAFGDFPRVGKVTRGLGRSAQIVGSRSRPAPEKISGGCRAERPHKKGAQRGKPLCAPKTEKLTVLRYNDLNLVGIRLPDHIGGVDRKSVV